MYLWIGVGLVVLLLLKWLITPYQEWKKRIAQKQ
jgi:hypothetical protein